FSVNPINGWVIGQTYTDQAKVLLAVSIASSKVLSPIAVEISKKPGMNEKELTSLIQNRFMDDNEAVFYEMRNELQ
ncbi:hypothetical protein, partial [Escherichia coli]|uniref:hypothetical protein n=2 Tax=Enterobacteriaceae TaxID=543 RepID=UPI0013D4BA67